MHRLIFFEGIPCTGKSTASHWLSIQMQRAGIDTQWFYEEESEQAHPLHVYQAPTSRELAQRSLEKLRRFAQRQANMPAVSVFEGTLFATCAAALFARDEQSQDEIFDYYGEALEIIRPLDPLLVYLRHADPAAILPLMGQSRKETWLNWFIGWTCQRPYAKNRGLEGYEGAARYWRDYQGFCDQLHEHFTGAKLALEVSTTNWETNRRRVLEFLHLDHRPDAVVPHAALAACVGEWKDRAGQWLPRHGAPKLATMLEDGQLFIEGLWWRRARLIPKSEGADAFTVEGICLEVHFQKDANGAVQSFRVGGRPVGSVIFGKTFERVA